MTATKIDTPLVETPQAVSVVDDTVFRDRGARNRQETMRYSAGVTGEAYGLDTRNDATVIRGLSPVQFLDGMRNFYTYAPFARNSIDTLDREFEGLKIQGGSGVTEWGDGGRWNFSLAGGGQIGARRHA